MFFNEKNIYKNKIRSNYLNIFYRYIFSVNNPSSLLKYRFINENRRRGFSSGGSRHTPLSPRGGGNAPLAWQSIAQNCAKPICISLKKNIIIWCSALTSENPHNLYNLEDLSQQNEI